MKKHIDKAENAIQEVLTKVNPPVLYTAIAILAANNTTNELIQLGIFFILFTVIVIQKHDSRIPIAFALILLMLSAFQLAFITETAANHSAIFAYYLLCVGVLAQFIEYLRNPEDFEEKTDNVKPIEEEEEKIKMPDIPRILREESSLLSEFLNGAREKINKAINHLNQKYKYKPKKDKHTVKK